MNLQPSRRDLLKGMAGASAAFCINAMTSTTASAAERPNLIFILSDDHMHTAMRCAGNKNIRTPNLDRIAREGIRFTHAYVSDPVCTPSRACVQTGQYGFRNDVTFFNIPIAPDSPRIARLLADAGYATAFTGKWHNDGRPIDHGFQHMRDVFLGGMHAHDSIDVIQGAEDKPKRIPRPPTEVFTDAALAFLEDPLPEPFALFIWYTAPHDPRTPPAEYEAQYPVSQIPLPPDFMPEPAFDPLTLDIRDEKLLPRPLDPMAIRQETARYYGLITYMDAQIGRVIKKLEDRAILDRTLIAFAGDNGLTLGAHGLLGKQTMYEEGVRVPLMLRGPGVPRGKTSEALVDIMDLMPTFCDAAGVSIPNSVQGRSLAPFFSEKTPPQRDVIFCHYDDLFRMIRTRQYKYIKHLKTDREELYDLEKDPYERSDLAASPVHARVLENLRERLQQSRTEAGELK